ncbi:MAG: ATP12 family chaperone protein [Alphaproteobacteria bacterium]
MKKFYKTVAVEPREGGHAVLLDGKPIRTPAGKPLAAPTAALAEAIAAEWRGQGERVKPATMPLTQLLNTALDRMAAGRVRDEAIAEICAYAETDLVCFRAPEPAALARRQRETWQPLLDWLAGRHGAALAVSESLAAPPRAGEPGAHRRRRGRARCAAPRRATRHRRARVDRHRAGARRRRLDADAAFEAAHLDERHQMEEWGEDAEARAARSHPRRGGGDGRIPAPRGLSAGACARWTPAMPPETGAHGETRGRCQAAGAATRSGRGGAAMPSRRIGRPRRGPSARDRGCDRRR